MTYTTTRTTSLLLLALALSIVGCGGGTSAEDDAGGVASGDAAIAHEDAHAADLDAGEEELTDGGGLALDAASAEDASASSDDSGSILPPLDAGSPFSDGGGALGEPAWVSVEVRTDGSACAALTPCGGDVLGTWDVTGGCFELDVESTLSTCPGAAITRRSGTARGRVTFDGTRAVRQAQAIVEVEASIPALCATVAGGCAALQTLVQRQVPDAACVDAAAGGCLCQVRQGFEIDDSDLYTTTANQIVSSTTGHRWAYCVDGDSLRYEDVTPDAAHEPGIIELGRR